MSISELVSRRAKSDDNDCVFKLANQLSESININKAIFEQNFEELIHNNNHCILVAEINHIIEGYLSGNFYKAFYANGTVAFIDEIVVDSRCRNLSIGKRLMEEFEAIAKTNKSVLISLATSGAKGFYEKLDYSSTSGYYKKYL
jgi:ribosomal protein S18 acetylase RimI-like enzyme